MRLENMRLAGTLENTKLTGTPAVSFESHDILQCVIYHVSRMGCNEGRLGGGPGKDGMALDTRDYLNILKDDVHSVVFATMDRDGYPTVRVIDIMLADENALYFITAKSKEFYRQLTEREYVAISGVTGGGGSLSKKAVSVRDEMKELDAGLIDRVFEENPYMIEVYPDKESRMAIAIFYVARGKGEYFDLSVEPITRKRFLIGDQGREEADGYFITRQCRGCGNCLSKCPRTCITTAQVPFEIQKEHYIQCGNCLEVCPFGAVVRREEDGTTAGQ